MLTFQVWVFWVNSVAQCYEFVLHSFPVNKIFASQYITFKSHDYILLWMPVS